MTTAFQSNAFQWDSFQIDLVLEVPAGSMTFVGNAGYMIIGTEFIPASTGLSLSSDAPSVDVTESAWLTPDVGTLSFTGQTPQLDRTNIFTPGTYALHLTGFAALMPVKLVPGTRALRLSGKRPILNGLSAGRPRSLYVVDPIGMSMRDWADAMVMQLEPHTYVARLDSQNWKGWAAWLTAAPDLSYNHPPSPYDFNDWRDWAKSFNNALSPAGF